MRILPFIAILFFLAGVCSLPAADPGVAEPDALIGTLLAQNQLRALEVDWKSARHQAVIAGALPDPMFITSGITFAQRSVHGLCGGDHRRFIDFTVKRQEAARFGLTVKNVEDIVETAIGGKNIIQNVEGRERYPVNIRYPPDFARRSRIARPRADLDSERRPDSISRVEDIQVTMGPPSIRDENGRLAGFVYVDVSGRDLGSFVAEAKMAGPAAPSSGPATSNTWKPPPRNCASRFPSPSCSSSC